MRWRRWEKLTDHHNSKFVHAWFVVLIWFFWKTWNVISLLKCAIMPTCEKMFIDALLDPFIDLVFVFSSCSILFWKAAFHPMFYEFCHFGTNELFENTHTLKNAKAPSKMIELLPERFEIYWTLMMFFAELMDCCTMRLEQHVVVMQLWQTQVSWAPVCSPKRAFRVNWTRLFKCMIVSWNFPRFSMTFWDFQISKSLWVLWSTLWKRWSNSWKRWKTS